MGFFKIPYPPIIYNVKVSEILHHYLHKSRNIKHRTTYFDSAGALPVGLGSIGFMMPELSIDGTLELVAG